MAAAPFNTMRLDRDDLLKVVSLTPLVSIDLVIKDSEGRVLLGLRENEPARNYWFVPGGRIYKNERIPDAFRRISVDELGVEIAIENARFIGVFEHIYDENFAQQPDVGTHYVVLAHEITLNKPLEKLPNDQHRHYQWLTSDEILRARDVHPNTRAYFE